MPLRNRIDLTRAVELGVITPAQADALTSLDAAAPLPPARPGAVLLALGAAAALALVPLGAWWALGGGGLVAGLPCAALLLAAGRRLWRGPNAAAGGVLVAAAALMVAPTVHGLEHLLGWLPRVPRDAWTLSELLATPSFAVDVSAVVALGLARWRFRFPPLWALLVGTAWIAAMAAAPLVFDDDISWSQRALVSMVLGASVIAAGVAADRRALRRDASWLYAAGLVALLGGLTTFTPASRAAGALLVALAAAVVVLGMAIGRPAFAALGALAAASCAGRLAGELVRGPALVAVAAALAAATLWGAVLYRPAEALVRAWAAPLLGPAPPAPAHEPGAAGGAGEAP